MKKPNSSRAHKKRKKPRGEIGPLRVQRTADGPVASWQKISIPEGKEEIEQLFAERFIAAYRERPLIERLHFTGLRRNPENSLDFMLDTSEGEKWLDLMEISPIEFFGVRPEQAPSDYNAYDFAAFIHAKISAKIYSRGNNVLLLYLTDWRFVPSQTVVALLQYWCTHESHSFDAIFLYVPLDANAGHISLVAPTPQEFWKDFDPVRYKENRVINLDPSKWRLAFHESKEEKEIAIKTFPHGEVSPDGLTIFVHVELQDGSEHSIKVPFAQLDWLVQGLMQLGNAAHSRQLDLGHLAPLNPIDPAMIAETFRVLPNLAEQHAIVQLIGRPGPAEPLGIGSARLSAEQLQGLGQRMLEVAAQLQNRGAACVTIKHG